MLGDILTLQKPIAPSLIRALYTIALILIALGVARGLVAGAWMIGHPPPLPPAVTADTTSAAPSAAVQPAPPPRRDFRRSGPRMMAPAFLRQGPMPGVIRIVRTLVMGAVFLMIVRVLAEVGLAVLAMPREKRGAG